MLIGRIDKNRCRLYWAFVMFRLLALAIALGVNGPAWAQPSERDQSEAKELDPFERARNTPLEKKTANVEAMLSKQRSAVSRTAQFLSDARTERDVVRANCLDQKLKLLSGLLKLSEASSQSLFDAVASQDTDSINQSYAKVLIASQRSQTIAAEANQCVGATAVYSGTTEVTVQRDDSGGAPDPTSSTISPPVVSTPPVSSSF
jgi:hypothetical protein